MGISKPVTVLLLLLLLVVVFLGRWFSAALDVATGYAAKQLCSGVFVAGLPADFVRQRDIDLAMASLGLLLPRLETRVSASNEVTSTLLGSEAVAVFTGEQGCVLNPGLETWPAPETDRGDSFRFAGLPIAPSGQLAAVFDAAFAEPGQGQRRTLAIVVRHRGRLIAERYAEPADVALPLQGWSMNKSLMATWVGMQVERGEMALDTRVQTVVAALDPSLSENLSPELELLHLLHMESGLDFEETYFPGDDATRMLYRSPAMWRVAPGNGHRYGPGEFFSYSSGDTNLAAMLWSRSLGGRSYTGWIRSEFVEPLGLEGVTSEADSSGVQVGSSYTHMPARSWAKVGQFWLDAWHGRSDHLSREWMRDSVTPRSANTGGDYGRGFWLNTRGDAFPGLPTNLFYASGHNSQYVMVLPEQELVLVRLGLSSSRDVDGFRDFATAVAKALR
jgi:CubicO group peptidase (beta-lactamase class C family)